MTVASSLDEVRLTLAPEIARAAAFDGWSRAAVASAAASCDIAPEIAALAFPPEGGAMAMIAAWTAQIDAAMAEALPAQALAGLPVRERIRRLVAFRLEALRGDSEALRRALAIMAMPPNLARGAALAWRSADAMWRLAGDHATDFNHYSKRAILAGLYAATLLVFLDDDSADKAATAAFLGRRIDGVIAFEKAKARLLPRADRDHFSPARFLGRLRYPAR